MSLASEITETVNALAAVRKSRRAALRRIREETAHHLGEARSALRHIAADQQAHLDETVRSVKLATAIVLGAADERIDGFRKTRVRQAAAQARHLAAQVKGLQADTRKWMSTQYAVRQKQSAQDLRRRRVDRIALRNEVRALTSANIAFVKLLTKDRQAANRIWLSRAVSAFPRIAKAMEAPAPHSAKAMEAPAPVVKAEAPPPASKVETMPAQMANPGAMKAGSAAQPAKQETAKHENAKHENAKPEAPRHEPPKHEAAKADTRGGAPAENKASGGKQADPGKA